MVELYYTLVKQGRRTIERVPERYRAEVQGLLDDKMVD
ncbi:MAG TPA: CD1375 family protein [Clostridia bacterium]|nr:CD1375 family protein [Clostridia bacterium]